MGKSLFDLLLDSIFDDAWVGKRGEKMTERELKLVQLFGRKGKVLRNVYLPKENGETSEVDVKDSTGVAQIICPKCGAPMVLRTAKKGNNSGNQFYGCTNFPKCRGIKSL